MSKESEGMDAMSKVERDTLEFFRTCEPPDIIATDERTGRPRRLTEEEARRLGIPRPPDPANYGAFEYTEEFLATLSGLDPKDPKPDGPIVRLRKEPG